ncbi:MAG: DinB family protein [Bacteroidia bacterium]|nr:DinB family protein [Bacteroidia bacterium]
MQSKELFLEDMNGKLEKQLQLVIGQLQNLPEAILNKPSATGGWSITECLAHLNSYYDYYLPKMHQGLINNQSLNNNMVKHTFMGRYFINMMNHENTTKKYKAAKKHLPLKKPNAYTEIANFITHSENLIKLIAQFQHKNTNQVKIQVSVIPFIKINLNDALAFMIAHQERHLKQALRNL